MNEQTITAKKPNLVYLDLVDSAQQSLASQLLQNTSIKINNWLGEFKNITDLPKHQNNCHVTHFIDGRGLHCPQPLLKTKLALRERQKEHGVYMVATDTNSVQDMQVFAKQQGLILYCWSDNNLHHFIMI